MYRLILFLTLADEDHTESVLSELCISVTVEYMSCQVSLTIIYRKCISFNGMNNI